MQKRRDNIGSAIKNIKDIVLKPVAGLIEGVNIEIVGDRDIFVEGCIGIEEFTEKQIIFLGNKTRVIVKGEEFEIFTFADGRIKASGRIDNVTIDRRVK